MTVLALALVLAQAVDPGALRIQQGTTTKGYADTLRCSTGTTCSVSAGVATLTAAGGAGGSPGGISGNVQVNSAGAFGAYTGTSCTYAVKSLDASGVASCTAAPTIPADLSAEPFITKTASANLSNEFALGSLTAGLLLNTPTTGVPTIYGGSSCGANLYATSTNASGALSCNQVAYGQVSGTPTIPADISGAHYVTTQAEAGLSAEAVLPTCTGTDKLTFNGTTISCATDQTSAGGGYATVQEEGVSQTARTTLNFIGPAVTAADDAVNSKTKVTVVASGTGTCTNQFVTATNDGAAPTCTTATLASAQFANQGTTTTLPHGNAAGNPAWGNIVSADFGANLLGLANGGTNAALTAANGAMPYSTASAFALLAPGTAGQVLTSGGAGAPTWGGVWQFLGTATGATTTVGPIVWTAAVRQIQCWYQIKGYNGGTPVGRFLIGTASISTTALTNSYAISEGVTAPTTASGATATPGIPLAVTLSAVGRAGTITVDGASGSVKVINVLGQNQTPAVATVPTIFQGASFFSDLGTNLAITRAQLTVFDTLTATAASAQAFLTGTYLACWGRNTN